MNKEFVLRAIGLKIRKLRNVKNLSLIEFSERLDVEYNNLIRIEKGRANMTINTLLKISNALGVDLSDLVNIDAKI
jgi:transcriptional regulator with XRE-family HTH domain